jgi:tetratricopeptide (TPR) repeat protein
MSDQQEKTTARRSNASAKLQVLARRYALQREKIFSKVVDELIELCSCDSKTYDSKTIHRDLGIGDKKPHKIQDLRVEKYARWLYKVAQVSSEEISQWLDLTEYKWPGELLLKITRGIEQDDELYKLAKRDPDLRRPKLWTAKFLGRDDEIKRAIAWADDRQHFPIAILHGFGGSGKTTLQLKLGRDFILNSSRTLRWPFEGVVWISADKNRALSLPGIWRKIAKVFELGNDSPISEASDRQWVESAVRTLLEEKRILVLIDSFEALSSLREQVDILKFFNSLEGYSKTLLSSRHDFDGLLKRHNLLSETRYIKVEGLSPENTNELINELINGYIERWSVPAELFPSSKLDDLAEITGNTPQAIIAALSVVANRWISLADLLDSITSGKQQPKADQIFEEIIGQVWKSFLKKHDKSVLMAKAFFSGLAPPDALGLIAGVGKPDLETACDTLRSISFFEKEGSEHCRISTHPLAQAYALRMIKDDPDSRSQMETRWWCEYAPTVLKQASEVSYESVQPELEDSVADVLAHIEKHIAAEKSPHLREAVNLFLHGDDSSDWGANHENSSHGIGHILRHWGKWDDLIRVATLCLDHIKKDPRLIRECALRLLARAHYERRESDEAWTYIALAEHENAKLKNKRLEAAILYSRAEVLRQQGRFLLATSNLKDALKIFNEDGGKHTYDIAPTYMVLGGCTTELAAQNLTEGVDKDDLAAKGLREAERYLKKSESLFKSQGVGYPEKSFDVASIRAYKAVIARLRGEFNLARQLFEECEGQFPSISSVARLYRERALVEHLDGNIERAHGYEEKGLALMESVGLKTEQLPKYNCYRVIERMKLEGTW